MPFFSPLKSRFSSLFFAVSALVAVLLTSCVDAARVAETDNLLSHARWLTLRQHDAVCEAMVRNPWDSTAILAHYVLLGEGVPVPQDVPDEATVLRVPLQRVALMSSVHAALALDLGAASEVASLADTAYAVRADVRAMVRRGDWADGGSSIKPDVEAMVMRRTDAVWVSPMAHATHGAMAHAPLAVVVCADYMEPTPLARAEWMRFYGRLLGQTARADSLFEAVAQAYTAAQSHGGGHRPRVMMDTKQGASWFVPGAQSYVAALLMDAGFDYAFADAAGQGSVPLTMEEVMTRARDSEVWLLRSAAARVPSYAALAQDNAAYAHFRPYRQHRVYACPTLRVPYFEDIAFHPDRILGDLRQIAEQRADTLHYFFPLPLR